MRETWGAGEGQPGAERCPHVRPPSVPSSKFQVVPRVRLRRPETQHLNHPALRRRRQAGIVMDRITGVVPRDTDEFWPQLHERNMSRIRTPRPVIIYQPIYNYNYYNL